jgi:hypothetical protein
MNQQDYLMHNHAEGIDSSYSFKPIEHLGASEESDSTSFDGEPMLSTAIFRDTAEGLHIYTNRSNNNNNNDPMSISPLQLANPIFEQRGSVGDVDGLGGSMRVISPYPFFHASQQEVEERQQLKTWSMPTEETIDASTTREHSLNNNKRIDYSLFFQSGVNQVASGGMDCDDFSISSHEAESIEDDLWCFEKISGDPAAFWEEGMDHEQQAAAAGLAASDPARVTRVSPSLHSSTSSNSDSVPVRPMLSRAVSVGKVPRRRPVQPAP